MRFWIFPLFALTLSGQTPSFEVASIRPKDPPFSALPLCGNRVVVSPDNILSPESLLSSGVNTLSGLLSEAYNDEVEDFDFPQWSRLGPFTISVKIPPNTSARLCRKMLQNLLAERFHTVVGVEIREVPRYFVKVAKSGLKLKPVEDPPDDPNASYRFDVKNGNVRYVYHGASMSRILNTIGAHAFLEARARGLRFAGNVSDPDFRIAGVVDETGLTGYYDGEFQFAPAAILHDEFAESLEDAMSRQLGLTLELRRAPGKVLVIRSSDRVPTEN